jgi:arabinose-5-phosphate isomerase
MHSLIAEQRRYINHFFEKLDAARVAQAAEKLIQCRGTCYFSGLGKSGLIAQKVAAALVSVGARAQFLHPVEALHGDAGIVQPGDLAVLLSKSGETQEMLHLAHQLRLKQVGLIGAVCTEQNRLMQAVDLAVVLPLERELCPFNLMPTTSTAVQLLFGDLLTQAVTRARRVEIETYAGNHPGGQIGLRTTVRVADLMLKGDALPVAAPEVTLEQALDAFSSKRCGCLLIVEQGQLLGIFTDGDLRRALQSHTKNLLQQRMRDLMTRCARTTVSTALAWQALQQMESDPQRPITVLPVVDDGILVGLIKMHDILQAGI